MAAVRNINFSDPSAVNHLLCKLGEDPMCIEMLSGEIVRPSEAIRMLGGVNQQTQS
jgi:hypothetical protein